LAQNDTSQGYAKNAKVLLAKVSALKVINLKKEKGRVGTQLAV